MTTLPTAQISRTASLPQNSGSPKFRFLLVDDDQPTLEFLGELLELDGHHVTRASGGPEALACYQQCRPDVLLTDRAMPGMTGPELAEALHRTQPDLPTVLVTGFSPSESEFNEIDAVVGKPCTRASLWEGISRALLKSRARLAMARRPPVASAPAGSSAPAPARQALGSSVSSDLEALRNDLDQARELACDYQRQLAGKSNDLALIKRLFEKATADLAHLQNGIAQLRQERHQLANDAMRAAALELKQGRLAAERDRAENEARVLRAEAAAQETRLAEVTAELRSYQEGSQRAKPARPERLGPPPKAEPIAIEFQSGRGDDGVSIVPPDPAVVEAARVQRYRSR